LHFFTSRTETELHVQALRVVHHKHAAKVASHASIVRLHSKKLLNLQREIDN
jgi:hypothetical protein